MGHLVCCLFLFVGLFVNCSASLVEVVEVVEGTSVNYLNYAYDKVIRKVLGLDSAGSQVPGCTVDIVNNMAKRILIAPMVWLSDGKTQVPPPLLVSPAGGTVSMVFTTPQHLFLSAFKDTSCGVVAFVIKGGTSTQAVYIMWQVNKMISPLPDNMYFDVMVEALPGSVLLQTDLSSKLTDFVARISKSALGDGYKAMIGGKMRIADEQPGFTVRAQMTNSIYSKLSVSFEDKRLLSSGMKRTGVELLIGKALLTTTMTALTNKIIEVMSKQRVVVLNLNNDAKDLILVNPLWSISGVSVQDGIPWLIKPEQQTQLSVSVKFLEGETWEKMIENSVFLLSYEIQSTTTELEVTDGKRIVFAIKWPKTVSITDPFVHSVFLLGQKMSDLEVLAELERIGKDFRTLTTAVDASTLQLTPPNQLPTTYTSLKQVPYKAFTKDTSQRYSLWSYELKFGAKQVSQVTGVANIPNSGRILSGGTSGKTRVLNVATMMGNREDATNLKVYLTSKENTGQIRSNPSDYTAADYSV